MSRHRATRAVLLLAVLCGALLVPTTTAQDSLQAVDEKVDDERAAAEEDAAGWATGKASENGTGDDLRWTARTGCLARDDAEDATGQTVPDPAALCPALEDAIAVAAGEEEAEEEAAVAEPLDDDTEARLEAYLDESADMVARILAAPQTAVAESLGFLDRTLVLLRTVAENLLGALGRGASSAVTAPIDGLQALTLTAEGAAWALADGARAATAAPIALGEGLAMAAEKAAHGVTAVAEGAYGLVRDLFGGPSAPAGTTDGTSVGAATDDLDGPGAGLPGLPTERLAL